MANEMVEEKLPDVLLSLAAQALAGWNWMSVGGGMHAAEHERVRSGELDDIIRVSSEDSHYPGDNVCLLEFSVTTTDDDKEILSGTLRIDGHELEDYTKALRALGQ
jgi:hypothetical protein